MILQNVNEGFELVPCCPYVAEKNVSEIYIFIYGFIFVM